MIQSPFPLGGTLKQQLESLKVKYPKEIEETTKSLYVISGIDTVDQGYRLKEVAVSMFGEAGFKLHK